MISTNLNTITTDPFSDVFSQEDFLLANQLFEEYAPLTIAIADSFFIDTDTPATHTTLQDVTTADKSSLDAIPKGFDHDFFTWVDKARAEAERDHPDSPFLSAADFSPFTRVCGIYPKPEIVQKYIEAHKKKIIKRIELVQFIRLIIGPSCLINNDALAAQLITVCSIPTESAPSLYETASARYLLQTAKALLPKISPNMCPLHFACKHAFLELIQDDSIWKDKFLVYGRGHTTPLHWIAMARYTGPEELQSAFIARKQAIIKILVDRGIDLTAKDIRGATMGHYIGLNNEEGMLAWLVNNYPDRYPAMTANLAGGVSLQHLQAVSIHPKTALSPQIVKDTFGRTPHHYACYFYKSLLQEQDIAFIKGLYADGPQVMRGLYDNYYVTPDSILKQRCGGLDPLAYFMKNSILSPPKTDPSPTYGMVRAMKLFIEMSPELDEADDLLKINFNKPVIAAPAGSSKGQPDWLRKAALELVQDIIKQWKKPPIQEALKGLLVVGKGVREFNLNSLGKRDITDSILLPLNNFSRLHKNSENQAIAYRLGNGILLRSRLCEGNNKTLPPELGAIDFVKEPQLLAFSEMFFSYTLKELELYSKNIELLFAEEKQPDRVVPAYFLQVHDSHVSVVPLVVQQEMPSKSLLAVGRDASGIAVKQLEEILSKTFSTNETISLTSGDCEKLLCKYKEGKKDIFLFTMPPPIRPIQERVESLASSSRATEKTTTSTYTWHLHDPVSRTSLGQSNRSMSFIRNGEEGEESPAKKRARRVDSGALATLTQKPEGQEVSLPQGGNVQPLVQNDSSTIDSLDALLGTFSERAQKQLEQFADLAKNQEAIFIEKTKELTSALLQPSSAPTIHYNDELLKSYQQQGVSWMFDLHKKGLGGVLASEPGLGKTRQAVSFLFHLKKLEPTGKPMCIIVPKGILQQWIDEIHKYLFEEHFAYLQSHLGTPHIQAFASSLTRFYDELLLQLKTLKTHKESLWKRRYATEAKRTKAINEATRKIAIMAARKKRFEEFILQTIEVSKIPEALMYLQHKNFMEAKIELLEDASSFLHLLAKYTQEKEFGDFFAALLKIGENKSSEACIYKESLSIIDILSQKTQQTVGETIKDPGFATSGRFLLCTESTLLASADVAGTLKQIPFACVIVDEAHDFRWKLAQEGRDPKSASATAMQDLLSSLKKSHLTSSFLLTGTPFVNTYDEFLSLLQLTNTHIDISAFTKELYKHRSRLSRSLIHSELHNEELLINPTNYFQALEYAKAIQNKLILMHQKSDQNVRESWTLEDRTVCIPEKCFELLTCELTDRQKQLYEKLKTGNPILFGALIEKIIFQPDLLDVEEFQGKTFQEIVCESGLLKRLFKEEGELDNAIQQKKPTLFFVRQKVVGKALKKLLKMKYPSVGVSFYHGSKQPLKRDELVQRFESPDDPLRILIISQEAGGVGLNLPSAKVVFDLARWWNDAVTAQAEARALRAGTSGVVDIYAFFCKTPFEEAMQAIVLAKQLWKKYFFEKPEEAFACFLQAFAFEAAREEATSQNLIQRLTAYDASKLSWQLNIVSSLQQA